MGVYIGVPLFGETTICSYCQVRLVHRWTVCVFVLEASGIVSGEDEQQMHRFQESWQVPWGGFPKIGGTFLGVPIIRPILHKGLH